MVWMCECGCGLVSCMLLWKQWMLQKNETDVVRRGVTTAQGHVVPTPSSVALLWLPHNSLALEETIALLYNSDGFWWTTHIYSCAHTYFLNENMQCMYISVSCFPVNFSAHSSSFPFDNILCFCLSVLFCVFLPAVEKCMSSMQMGTQMLKLRGSSKGLVRFFYLDEHKSCIRWRPSRKNEKAKSECCLLKGTVRMLCVATVGLQIYTDQV